MAKEKKRRKLHGNGRSTRQRASSAKDKRAELNWSWLSARFPPFYARGCAGTWRLVEDFPGNLCPDRAQPRHATSHATPRPADLQFLPLTCVNLRTRISTRTLFHRRKYSPTTLYRDCPVSLDQSGETNFSIYGRNGVPPRAVRYYNAILAILYQANDAVSGKSLIFLHDFPLELLSGKSLSEHLGSERQIPWCNKLDSVGASESESGDVSSCWIRGLKVLRRVRFYVNSTQPINSQNYLLLI